MTTNSTERHIAKAVGAVATLAALAILWQDVLMGHAAPTLEHFLIVAIVGITITAGHLAINGRQLSAFVGFGFLFVLGTVLTIYTSVGNQASVADNKTRNAEVVASERSRMMALRDKAELMLGEERRLLAKECASGKGKRCDGIATSIGVYTAAVKGHNADLAKLPVLVVNARPTRFAKVLALTGLPENKVAEVAYLIEPFAYSLFLELCAIVAFGFGFGGRRPAKVANDNPPADLVPVPDVPEIEPTKDEKVVAFSKAFKAEHGRVPTQAELRKAFGDEIAKATMHRIVHRTGLAA